MPDQSCSSCKRKCIVINKVCVIAKLRKELDIDYTEAFEALTGAQIDSPTAFVSYELQTKVQDVLNKIPRKK